MCLVRFFDFPDYCASIQISETVLDGEIVALDSSGKPSFNTLQNYGSITASLFYYVFDVLFLGGIDVMGETLVERRALLEKRILPKLREPIRYSPELKASLKDLMQSVKAQGLEGLVGKRRESKYEPGQRSGAWQKARINQGQELVIGGYTPSDKNFDALIIGYYEAGKLMYASRTRNGFTPASRIELFRHFKGLRSEQCPFGRITLTHEINALAALQMIAVKDATLLGWSTEEKTDYNERSDCLIALRRELSELEFSDKQV